MKRQIERYFDHKWEVDKNIIINKAEYDNFLQQIPSDVIDAVYKNFLFTKFLSHYKKLFQYPKEDSPNDHAFYTWEDVEYRTLMFGILNNLEPIRYESKEIIYDELDEYSAVIFLMNDAFFQVGYSINKEKVFKIKLKNNNIGGYGVAYKHKSKYIYRAQASCEAYFIRAKAWLEYLEVEDTAEIAPIVKDRLKRRYFANIEKNLKKLKKIDLENNALLSAGGEVIHMADNPFSNREDKEFD